MKSYRLIAFLAALLIVQSCCLIRNGGNNGNGDNGTEPPKKPSIIGSVSRIFSRVESGPLDDLQDVSDKKDLINNDAVRVTGGGVAQMNFGEQIEVKLFNDSELGGVSAEISPNTPRRVSMKLERGGLSGQVTEPGGSAEISVISGVNVTILGTSFFILYDEETGYTTIGNFDGEVIVRFTGGVEQVLLPGELVDFDREGRSQFYILPFSLTEFEELSVSQRSPIRGVISLRTEYQMPLAGEPVEQPSEPLVVWHNLSGVFEEIIFDAIYNYSTNIVGITYEVEQVNEIEKIYAAFNAGVSPDILIWDHVEIGQLSGNGYISDLREFGIGEKYLVSNFEPPAAASVRYLGGIWGLPINEAGIALIYNNELMLKRYFPTGQYNFGSLFEKSKQFLSENNAGNNFSRFLFCNPGMGYEPTSPAYFTAPIFLGMNYPDTVVPGYVDEGRKVYLTSSSILDAGFYIESFFGVVPEDGNYQLCRSLFLEGLVAAWWTGPWELEDLRSMGYDLGILPMGRPFVSTTAAMVTSSAVERGNGKAAIDLIRQLSGSNLGLKLAETGIYIPANSKALAASRDPLIKDFGSALRDGVPLNSLPVHARIWEPIDQAITAIWTKELTPPEALELAQESVENIVGLFR